MPIHVKCIKLTSDVIKWHEWITRFFVQPVVTGIHEVIAQYTACFSNDRTWSEEGDQRSQCPSVIYVSHELCVLCSKPPGSHKVGSQVERDVGSEEQNVNTDYGKICERV